MAGVRVFSFSNPKPVVIVGMKAWGVMLPPPLHGHNTCAWNRWVDVDEEARFVMIVCQCE